VREIAGTTSATGARILSPNAIIDQSPLGTMSK
jgi:hypothetical protein